MSLSVSNNIQLTNASWTPAAVQGTTEDVSRYTSIHIKGSSNIPGHLVVAFSDTTPVSLAAAHVITYPVPLEDIDYHVPIKSKYYLLTYYSDTDDTSIVLDIKSYLSIGYQAPYSASVPSTISVYGSATHVDAGTNTSYMHTTALSPLTMYSNVNTICTLTLKGAVDPSSGYYDTIYKCLVKTADISFTATFPATHNYYVLSPDVDISMTLSYLR